ncbi:AbrB family transcriptional regulator [Azohydromonas sp.]|uniref:AbrB family transcriptional regulator n=1 Tax=Azohydromonas sp. TaxID=1872666 RepID=UPI002CC17898|nr:AbrB family transcriptional regulator [Azohydromonas sp.]HMM84888.1 AbrB family transcriptional regulator [Azohydromonas sp.]
MSRPPFARIAGTLALAVAAGALAQALGLPLPWMLGPLFATAALSMAGVPLAAAPLLRNLGQWVIGVALGLYFTPEVLRTIASLMPALVAGVAWALVMGYAFYRLLWATAGRPTGGGRATAFFAAAIGGASEMAVLAERHGARVDRVAAAHSLRVLLVVSLIPFGLQAVGLRGLDATPPAVSGVDALGLVVLVAATLAGVMAARALRLPNAWVLGALAVTIALAASGRAGSALPPGASEAGQLCIGVALGTRFSPAFAREAPGWLGTVALGTLAMIAASAAFAWLLARLAGLHPATVLLGTSPGGIAEMCITAKVLQLGVPVVTAFHVIRYVAVLLLTGPLYGWIERRAAREA